MAVKSKRKSESIPALPKLDRSRDAVVADALCAASIDAARRGLACLTYPDRADGVIDWAAEAKEAISSLLDYSIVRFGADKAAQEGRILLTQIAEFHRTDREDALAKAKALLEQAIAAAVGAEEVA